MLTLTPNTQVSTPLPLCPLSVESCIDVARFGAHHLTPYVIVVDHASSHIPDPAAQQIYFEPKDWASDEHAAFYARRIAQFIGGAVVVSPKFGRFWIDVNRALDSDELCRPQTFAGKDIPWNVNITGEDRAHRLACHARYHETIAELVKNKENLELKPCIISVHTFAWDKAKQQELFDVGVVCEDDNKLAHAVLRNFRAQSDLIAAENKPFSAKGKALAKGCTLTPARTSNIPHVLFEICADIRPYDGRGLRIQTAIAKAIKSAHTGATK